MIFFSSGSGLIHRLVPIYRFYITICATLLQSQTNEKAKLSHTMVIVLVSPDVTVGAYVICSDKMLLNVVMMLSIFGVDKLMGFSSMGSCSSVFVTRTESAKYTQTS